MAVGAVDGVSVDVGRGAASDEVGALAGVFGGAMAVRWWLVSILVHVLVVVVGV